MLGVSGLWAADLAGCPLTLRSHARLICKLDVHLSIMTILTSLS